MAGSNNNGCMWADGHTKIFLGLIREKTMKLYHSI